MSISECAESTEMLYIKAFRWFCHINKIEYFIENCHQHSTQNAYKIHQKLTEGQKMDHGSRRMDTSLQITEIGTCKMDTGHWKMATGCLYPVADRPVSGASPRDPAPCSRRPGGPWAQYIRSGPEGARGVLDVRGLSLCMLLTHVGFLQRPYVSC